MGQISFNLVKTAFATRQLAFLSTGIMFYDIVAWACTEIKILDEKVMSLGFSIFLFFRLFLFASFLFAAVIDLLLGLLGVKKFLRKHH